MQHTVHAFSSFVYVHKVHMFSTASKNKPVLFKSIQSSSHHCHFPVIYSRSMNVKDSLKFIVQSPTAYFHPSYLLFHSFIPFMSLPFPFWLWYLRSYNIKLSYILTLILLTWRIWSAPNNASKWQMGFNSLFKGLMLQMAHFWTQNCDGVGM